MFRSLSVSALSEVKKEEEKPQEPATAEIKPNKKILIEVKIEKKPLGVIVTGGKNNHVKVKYHIRYSTVHWVTPHVISRLHPIRLVVSSHTSIPRAPWQRIIAWRSSTTFATSTAQPCTARVWPRWRCTSCSTWPMRNLSTLPSIAPIHPNWRNST